jgi:hypothetical protein
MADRPCELDCDYSITESGVLKLIERLEKQGHEVGLHGSFDSYNDCEMFVSQKVRLDHIVSSKRYGGRQHYLRWKTPVTWRIYEKAEMLYDATLGYADHEGFRCGFCLPFKPFDVLENRVIELWEIPLIFMDTTFRRYRDLSSDGITGVIRSLIASVSKHRGVFVALWHHDYMTQPLWSKLYQQTMKLVDSRARSCESVLSEMQRVYDGSRPKSL